jgi:hypothetical protein
VDDREDLDLIGRGLSLRDECDALFPTIPAIFIPDVSLFVLAKAFDFSSFSAMVVILLKDFLLFLCGILG